MTRRPERSNDVAPAPTPRGRKGGRRPLGPGLGRDGDRLVARVSADEKARVTAYCAARELTEAQLIRNRLGSILRGE